MGHPIPRRSPQAGGQEGACLRHRLKALNHRRCATGRTGSQLSSRTDRLSWSLKALGRLSCPTVARSTAPNRGRYDRGRSLSEAETSRADASSTPCRPSNRSGLADTSLNRLPWAGSRAAAHGGSRVDPSLHHLRLHRRRQAQPRPDSSSLCSPSGLPENVDSAPSDKPIIIRMAESSRAAFDSQEQSQHA